MDTLVFSTDGLAPLFAAYVKAQAQMGEVFKRANNPAFKTKYADLATVVDAVIPAFNASGLAVIQSPAFDGDVVTIVTMIAHIEGGWMRSSIDLRPSKTDPQGVGSAITYGRRYGLMAVAGVAPEDDDGNAASGENQRPNGNTVSKQSLAVTAAQTAITLCESTADLKAWKAKNDEMLMSLPSDDADEIVRSYTARWNAVKAQPGRVPLNNASPLGEDEIPY